MAALALLLAVLSQYAACDEQAPAIHRYQTCRAKIEKYVENRFQQSGSRVAFDFVLDYKSAGGGDGTKSTAVVYTNECPGYHVFELFATDFDCDALTHSGTVPNYDYYRTSQDGCRTPLEEEKAGTAALRDDKGNIFNLTSDAGLIDDPNLVVCRFRKDQRSPDRSRDRPPTSTSEDIKPLIERRAGSKRLSLSRRREAKGFVEACSRRMGV